LAPREPRPRRRFTAAEKLQIVGEYDACKRGERGALLRRYGIYNSSLLAWKQQLRLRGSQGLERQKPGPKSERDEKDTRIAELEKKLAHAEKKLSVARSVIEFQKKVSAMLEDESDGES
jgi:transposase-like protein